MIKQRLEEDLKKAISDLGYQPGDTLLSISQNSNFGDYSTNSALQLSKQKLENDEQKPLEIANNILEKLGQPEYLEKTEVAGPGFINFFIKENFLVEQLKEVLEKGENFGKGEKGQGKKIQVEFISANPTGPLTLANGRGGAIGDTLANVLSWSGFLVNREFYVNDTGNQVRLLGESVLAAAGKIEARQEHYQGEYVKELAEKFKDKLALEPQELGHLLADYLLEEEIKPATLRLGIKFDQFYSERSVYQKNLIEKAVKLLEEKGLAYESEGAVWFKATQFGDEKDRVIMTSEGGRGRKEPTYFLADIAHHLDDLSQSYIKRINVLGADHHGYAARMKGAMEALGYEGKLDFIFMQMVKLFKEGQEVRMSKRAGNFVTLDELLDLVGKDVARFFFLMYAPDSHIDFNLDLAKEKSNKNPVFYVQYAHARMSNILAKAEGHPLKAKPYEANLLHHPSEIVLIKYLSEFPDLIEEIAINYQVQGLTAFAIKLADLFHHFYEECQVLNAETEELKQARLALVKGSQQVLKNVLKLMGIDAPDRM